MKYLFLLLSFLLSGCFAGIRVNEVKKAPLVRKITKLSKDGIYVGCGVYFKLRPKKNGGLFRILVPRFELEKEKK